MKAELNHLNLIDHVSKKVIEFEEKYNTKPNSVIVPFFIKGQMENEFHSMIGNIQTNLMGMKVLWSMDSRHKISVHKLHGVQ